jgi:hypothetical protein
VRASGKRSGWKPFFRVATTPELWVAAQVRKRSATMAWTPGLTLDYARALSMLADPRPSGWVKMARLALQTMYASRQRWRAEKAAASNIDDMDAVRRDSGSEGGLEPLWQQAGDPHYTAKRPNAS